MLLRIYSVTFTSGGAYGREALVAAPTKKKAVKSVEKRAVPDGAWSPIRAKRARGFTLGFRTATLHEGRK